MELLQLPPELFQRIIKLYVASVGLSKAWKRREVCKTFNGYITEEIFGRQPMQAYTRKSSKQILRNGLAVFLEYRVAALHGADDFIPSVIRKSVDRIMAMTKNTSTAARATYIRKAAGVVQKNCTNVQSLIVNRGKRSTRLSAKDSEDALLLCLVAGMDDRNLIRLALKHCKNLWERTYTLGYPIAAAVRAEDLAAVEIFLKDPQSSNKRKVSGMLASVIAIDCKNLFKNGTYDFVKGLISMHHDMLGRPRLEWCASWYLDAKRSDHKLDFLKQLLGMGYTPALADFYRLDALQGTIKWDIDGPARIDMDHDLIRLLFKEKVFDANAVYSYKLYSLQFPPDVENESIFNYAVRAGLPDLMRITLEAGADPNGVITAKGVREYPIRTAPDNWEVVSLLLHHGADPEGGAIHHNEYILDLVPKWTLKYTLIEQAIQNKAKKAAANKKASHGK